MATLSHAPEPSIELFNRWLDAHHIKRHESISMVPMTPGASGFRIVATSPIPRGSVLCAVPKSMIFSHRTATLDLRSVPGLAEEPESSADVIYRLTACLLHELRLGEESDWYGWLQVLPRETIPVPVLWDFAEVGGEDGQAALSWLVGTEAGNGLLRQSEEDGVSPDGLRHFFTSLKLPATTSHPSPPTLTEFLRAYSLISSRGFMLDAYHQIGIPPFCDMFNHSSAAAHTSLLCDAGVCPTCGSLLQCPHDTKSDEGTIDRLNEIESSYLADLAESGEDAQVDMRVERDIQPGEEVFSCYEPSLTSAKALVGYGFVPSESSGSGIVWSSRDVLDQEAAGPFMRMMRRRKVLERLFGDQAESQSGKRLFKHTKSQRPVFSMDSDGIFSIEVFVAIYIRTGFGHARDYDSADEEEDCLVRDYKALQVAAQAAEELDSPLQMDCSKDGHELMAPVLESIVELLQERLDGMYRPELGAKEAEDIIAALPASAILQRQAMSFALSERRLLQEAIKKWSVILGDQATHTTWR